ncbi:S-adenosyl-L-methionine-dependent methyltransferase [Echria macrotheca]|uniref:S-adenosyl-L-methionine-dependent methyltransferase n=1 Tax=Echria macrotheca TaxID=438768 RepID=A0AAJ0B7T8_9PEZI|nr:S-adenosyl-L-methionine-dependent methyltransferase [Echria macrotheca]
MSDLPLRPASSEDTDFDPSIASSPCDIAAVPSLLADISFLRASFDVSTNRDARLHLLDKARALVRSLETPRETMLKHVGAETACFFSLALGVDVGLFTALAKGDTPKSVNELAGTIGFDVDGLSRILRHLAAMGYIVQTGKDEYKSNNFSKAMTIPIVADGYPFYRSVCIAPMLHLHKWLATKDYATPTTGRDNPFTFGNQTSQTMFEYLAAFPPFNEQFNHHMGGYRLGRPSWFDPAVYPVSDALLGNDIKADDVLLVDIGGNMGHDLTRFRAAFPDAPGRLILQDQASVIEAGPAKALAEQGIEGMPHDFFTEQPVRGARAYYLHHILHDWPDDKCEVIVKMIKSAMVPGKSKLLINEHVIPSVGASWEATYLDLYMMILFGSRERTEQDWKGLLEGKCGLKITRIYNPGNGVEGIIECEVPV